MLQQRGLKWMPVSLNPYIFKIWQDDRLAVQFYDTHSFMKCSLEQVGEDLNVPKIPFSFEGLTWEKYEQERLWMEPMLLAHCRRDVEITERMVKLIIERSVGHTLPVSISQLGIRLIRNMMKWPVQKLNSKVVQACCHGARNEIAKTGKWDGMKLYDMHGAYSWGMMQPLPTRLFKRFKNPSVQHIRNLVERHRMIAAIIGHVEQKKQFTTPYIYTRGETEEPLLYPWGRFSVALMSPEVVDWEQFDFISHAEVYSAQPFLRPYVERYYKKRMDSTGFDKDWYKLLLNSSGYGRWGYRYRRTALVKRDFQPSNVTMGLDFEDENGGLQHGKIYAGNLYYEYEEDPAMSMAVSGAIASYGRRREYDKLQEAGESFAYADTDDVVSRHDFPTGEGPGEFQLMDEGTYEGIARKVYRFNERIRVKGVSKSGLPESFDDIVGCHEFESPLTFTERIKRGITEPGIYGIVRKRTIKRDTVTRKWIGQGGDRYDSEPLHINA
jgi:hypothetical protein